MKLRKLLFGLILVISMMFVTIVEAKSPDSFTIVRDTSNIINYDQSIVSGGGSFTPVYFPLKYNSNGNYLTFCSGDRKANVETLQFTKTTFTNAYDGAIVAAIIKEGVGENATKDANKNNLFITQLAIWKSLPNTGISFADTEGALNSSQRTLFNNLISVGTAAKNRYNTIKNFAITLDATKLNFTLNGDTYESQVIKVTGEEIKTVTPSVNKGTVIEKNGGYVVTVKKDALSSGDNSITLTFNATSNSILVASNYTNGKSDEQTLTTTQFDEFSKTASKAVSGNINEEAPTYVYISKQDATTGEELPDAELVLKDSKGNVIDSWKSGITPHKVEKVLAAGKYTLSETMAPEGYEKTTETVTFTVKEDGTVDKQVIMYNKPKEIPNSPPTGTSTFMFILIGSFILFAIAFYYYAGYKVKKQM